MGDLAPHITKTKLQLEILETLLNEIVPGENYDFVIDPRNVLGILGRYLMHEMR